MTPEEERVIASAEKAVKERLMRGVPAYLPGSSYVAGFSEEPSVVVSVQKLGNGYMLDLRTNPKRPPLPRPVHVPSPFVGQDPDELIDQILDGMSAIIRTINDKGAGEDWKDEENRKQVRDAFRIMFPSIASQIDRAVSDEPETTYEEPRHEQLVFETKEKLFEYLTKNL